jgi:arginine/lysine/ornithine decarboxylase
MPVCPVSHVAAAVLSFDQIAVHSSAFICYNGGMDDPNAQNPHGDTLFEALRRESDAARLRFCMPGHKGKLNPLDMTEAGGMDNLLHPQGALKAAHARAADAYGAKAAHFCVNGASAGVMAMLCALPLEGRRVLISADCHLSAASALIHSGALPLMLPPRRRRGGLPLPSAASNVDKSLRAHKDIAAVLLTSPNYYGFTADVPAIAAHCRARGIPLLVDAAHGAHFGFAPALPPQPVEADAWVVSAHKTLPVENQGAMLFLGRDSLLDAQRLFCALSTFQTTSPSWPLLAAMDDAVFGLMARGHGDYGALLRRLRRFARALGDTPYRLIDAPRKTKDATRLVIDLSAKGLSGFEAAERLCERGVYIEMADARHLVLIASPADEDADFDGLLHALLRLRDGAQTPENPPMPPHGALCVSPRTAWYGTMTLCKLSDAAGRVAARPVGCYPPGVAAVLPGQRITRAQTAYLQSMARAGASLVNAEDDCIFVRP